MNTTFDTWLATLAAGGKGGSAISMPLATRGLKWETDVEISGNWSTATLEGSVSSAPDAASPLVTMTVGSATYSAVDDTTTWTVSLASGTGANSTGILPTDTDGDGVEYLPCAFYLTLSGGSKEMLFGAAFPLTGKA